MAPTPAARSISTARRPHRRDRLGEHRTLVPFAWSAVALNLTAFALFIVPALRRNPVTLNLGCLATYAGCYIEKGMGLIVPGLTPDTLGEIYEYYPTLGEVRVAAGIFAIGFLVSTLMLKVAVPITLGEFEADPTRAPSVP
jgi:Ni/Fe-hydrogenase subunit HybB-like protein